MFYQLTNDFAGTKKAKVDMFGARCEERTFGETNGLEATTTQSLSQWFNERGANMANGIGSYTDPPSSLDWSGPANDGKPG
jgi:hypothetical protein